MCFSATASFASSALLVSMGSAIYAKNTSVRQKNFLVIPLLFGIQQAIEGILWLHFEHNSFSPLGNLSIYLFLFFALVIWPTWVPWSVFEMETNGRRRSVLYFLRAIGVLVSVYATFVLMTNAPSAKVIQHSIVYYLPDTLGYIPNGLQPLLYFSSGVLPFFISSKKQTRTMGYFVLAGLIVAIMIKQYALTSVWCFFAALASSVIGLSVFSAQLKNYKLFN
jgi:hypothetical protein